MNALDTVLTLCTRFEETGDWTVEQQFVLQMGSSYLLAHGIGEPLKRNPRTTVRIPADGTYTLWVRTKNWTAFWSDGKTPGRFLVKVDGTADPSEFGTGCGGDTPAQRSAWYWQQGGQYDLSEGKHTLEIGRAHV